jgi:hypothetical protein
LRPVLRAIVDRTPRLMDIIGAAVHHPNARKPASPGTAHAAPACL